MTRLVLLLSILCLSFHLAPAQTNGRLENFSYEEVDLENMMKRYFAKSFSHSIEGIYSVSYVTTQRTKRFLFNGERIKVVGRDDNYAKVAIMKDWPTSNRDFIEVSLSSRKTDTFPIIGELDILADGAGYIYSHIEPHGERLTYSMVETDGLLEAEYSKIEKRRTITYRLTYLKIYPGRKGNVAAHGPDR